MSSPSAILSCARKLLIVVAGIILLFGVCACRRGANKNANGNGSGSSTSTTDPEQAKREAQTLVDQAKELYKNEHEKEAAEILKRAIAQDPNNAEAHLRLGMAYAALERKPEAEESYKKAIELYKKRVQADPKDAEAFSIWARLIVFYIRMKRPRAIIARLRASSLMTKRPFTSWEWPKSDLLSILKR